MNIRWVSRLSKLAHASAHVAPPQKSCSARMSPALKRNRPRRDSGYHYANARNEVDFREELTKALEELRTGTAASAPEYEDGAAMSRAGTLLGGQ
jgi:hypothetical protein